MRTISRPGARKIRGELTLLAAAVVFGLPFLVPAAAAQEPPEIDLMVDGEVYDLPSNPAGSIDEALAFTLDRLGAEGFPLAAADSIVVADGRHTIFLTRGPRMSIASVEIEGAEAIDPALLLRQFATRPGQPLDREVLADDIRSLLHNLDHAGRPFASAYVAAITPTDDGLAVIVAVEEGSAPVLGRLELTGDTRTDPVFAARLAGLRPGMPIGRFDAVAIRRDLEASGLFEQVGEPELAIDREGRAVVAVPVETVAPGAFDLVMGYLPPVGNQSGQLVGSGSLVLRNLFGRGRRMAVELVRNPGLVSSFDARVADPFLFELPLRLEARFSGYQADSTFSRQRLGLETGYRVAPGLEFFGSMSREFVDAGVAGATQIDGRPRVPGADAWFAGAGVRFARVDRPMNPRSGLVLETLLEQGTKRRSLPAGSEEALTVRQQRLHGSGRAFIPTFSRQALVLGGDAAIILGDVYDDSDLFRFGGATSLRGYDEEQFRGNLVGRAVAEYRLQLDPTSFAFAFFDLGYIRRPETPGVPGDERLAPGYGIGLQYRTPLGLATASYALNPDDGPTRGRVHVGLSIGL